jgi:hypothetical protein
MRDDDKMRTANLGSLDIVRNGTFGDFYSAFVRYIINIFLCGWRVKFRKNEKLDDGKHYENWKFTHSPPHVYMTCRLAYI